MLKRMAIALSQSAFSGSANMGEDQMRTSFRRQSGKIYAVPCWQSGSKDARVNAEILISIPSNSETVPIDISPSVQTKTRVI